MVTNTTFAHSLTDMPQLLAYIVDVYGKDIYADRKRLVGLLSDLYQGEERIMRIYKRAIMDDYLSVKIHNLQGKDAATRKAQIGALTIRFTETNFLNEKIGAEVVNAFVHGMFPLSTGELYISTMATPKDGKWVDELGVVYSVDRKMLIKCSKKIETYKVLEGTKVICDNAFFCQSLTSITLPNSVISIGDSAFYGSALTSVILPESTMSIGNYAFGWCRSLRSITLPDSVTSIGTCTFYNCSSLVSIIVPDSVTNIGDKAFFCCTSLYTITLPGSLTSIGDSAFDSCKSLVSITLPDSLTSIGYGTFRNCSSLTSIKIPASVTCIGECAFDGCSSLISINLSTLNTHFKLVEGNLYTKCGKLIAKVKKQ